MAIQEFVEATMKKHDEMYEAIFADYFKEARSMFNRIRSSTRPVTDEELAWVLETLPMQLFDVSECRAKLQLSLECSKLKLSSDFQQFCLSLPENEAKFPQSKLREVFDVKNMDDSITLKVYESLITRIDKEVQYCRELIMSSKKIWDARRKTEISNPVSEGDYESELPEYTVS